MTKQPTNEIGLTAYQQAAWDEVVENAADYGGREGVKQILDRSMLGPEQKEILLARVPEAV